MKKMNTKTILHCTPCYKSTLIRVFNCLCRNASKNGFKYFTCSAQSHIPLFAAMILTVTRYFVHTEISPSGHNFFIFCFTDFFRNKLGPEDEIKNKIHSDHFPIELKSKETQIVIGKWSE